MAYVATEKEKTERKEKRAAIMERAKALQEAGTVRAVAISITGKPYSGVNQCLIAAQNGPAGVYGGFRAWMKNGRAVRKGGHGVIIYAPIMKKPDATTTATDTPEKVAMTTAYVFHIEQTDPVAVPA